MSTIVTMTATVGNYVNGSTYRVRSRNAEQFVATSKATKLTTRKTASSGEGK